MKIAIFHFQLFGINTYIVWDEKSREAAIIDPGMMTEGEENALSEFIGRENLKVRHLINTHLHVDHAIGNAYVRNKFGVQTSASPEDAFLGERLHEQLKSFGIMAGAENVAIDIPLKDGDMIPLGEENLKVIGVPGHSPGGIALYSPTGGFVVTGDALFNGSIGRTDLPGGNYEQLIESVRNGLLTLPDKTIVYPGHGDPTTIDEEKLMNPFLR